MPDFLDAPKVSLVSYTQPVANLAEQSGISSGEGLMAYAARVSSPHQDNPDYGRLLRYCAKKKHWSVFEMVDMTVEIVTARAISPQALRHSSFRFQEFSQRYAEIQSYFVVEARRQDPQNRQNSIADMSEQDKEWWDKAQRDVINLSDNLYKQALERGIAKEVARFLLPQSVSTRLYMKGSVRSWIHYCEVRRDAGAQKEHRDIANQVWGILSQLYPTVTAALKEE